ncbi:MAG: YecA family protein [Syntrophobacteraceae bacterium]
MVKTGRNAPCPCGSGKKYKKCCLAKEREARRSSSEDQERRQLQVKRQPEEDRELFEDEFHYDNLDEVDEEEDVDETFEDSKVESRPRRRVPEETPPISDAEEQIVEKWWNKYKKMREIEEIRRHLEDFLRDHPELVSNLELHMEVLFDLGADYVKEGRHGEYIDLLLKMRSRFADSYLKSFDYYDRDINQS